MTDFKVKIFGVGGYGCNMLDLAEKRRGESAEYCAIDITTDVLARRAKESKIFLDPQLSGDEAAEQWERQMDAAVSGVDFAVIIAGEGGRAGSVIAPILAKAAAKANIPFVAMVISPFDFEGSARNAAAKAGIEELKKYAGGIVHISNQNLKNLMPKDEFLVDVLKKADEIFIDCADFLMNVIEGKYSFKMNFDKLKSFCDCGGYMYFATGYGSGNDRAFKAMEEAISCPAQSVSPTNAQKLLLISEGREIADLKTSLECTNFFHNVFDKCETKILGFYPGNKSCELKVTVLAAGIDE